MRHETRYTIQRNTKHDTRIKTKYRKLRVWQEAHQLALLTYKITKQFPKEELFCLTAQLRRAVISVSANIVEGYAYRSASKLKQFLGISRGSLAETEYFFELALDLGYINKDQYFELEEQRSKVALI